MSTFNTALKVTSISVSLLTAGGIVTLSLFDVPILRAQPASRSLPSVRWLFSRGSHVFPTAAFISAAGFSALAYRSLPASLASRTVLQLLRDPKVGGYLAAAVLNIAIAPWTSLVMIPNNFALIKMNNQLGGHRSIASSRAAQKEKDDRTQRSAEDSVNGNGEGVDQFTDLSDPQEQTARSSSGSEDEMVRAMLTKFGSQNFVRAVLTLAGGVVGLLTALG